MDLTTHTSEALNRLYCEAVATGRWSLCERIELEFVRRLRVAEILREL